MNAPTLTYSNVIALPVPMRTHRTLRLLHLDGREWASAGFPTSRGCAGDAWAWIVEAVAAELGVGQDAVGCAEGPDGEDFVTVEGIRVYEISWVRVLHA